MTYGDIEAVLAPHGLICRGGFHLVEADGFGPAASLLMIGNVGPAFWQAFERASKTRGPRDQSHPMDAWTRQVIDDVASRFGGRAFYPFDGPPYYPFQRWAARAESVFPSPIGPLIHPEYGLWHAYRGALVFDRAVDFPVSHPQPSPCDSCREKYCLRACPVGALQSAYYDVPACVSHLTSSVGGRCRNQGCQARHACPIGQPFAQTPAQAQFHMDKFIASQSKPPD